MVTLLFIGTLTMVTHWLDLIIFFIPFELECLETMMDWPKLHDPIISSFLCLKLGLCLFWGIHGNRTSAWKPLSKMFDESWHSSSHKIQVGVKFFKKNLLKTTAHNSQRWYLYMYNNYIYIYIAQLAAFHMLDFCPELSGSPVQLPHLVLWPLSLVALALEVGKWWISCRVCNQICLSKVAFSNENHLFVSSGDFKLVVISSWLHHFSINHWF